MDLLTLTRPLLRFKIRLREQNRERPPLFIIIGTEAMTGQTEQSAWRNLIFTTGRSEHVFASDQLQLCFPWGQTTEACSQSMLK